MNKKGTDKILSIYWFSMLLIVAGGIFGMVYTFYNHPYDVRNIESNLLLNSVADCISTGGQINSVVFENDFSDNLLEYCYLDFSVENIWETPQYLLKVQIQKEENEIINSIQGNLNLISSCGGESIIEDTNIAKCVQKEFYTQDENGQVYLIKILSLVRKTEKNVR